MAMRVFCVYFALADEHLAIVAAVVPHECRSPTCRYMQLQAEARALNGYPSQHHNAMAVSIFTTTPS